ncbi:MAG: hypothetical protein AB1486_11030 [Planctomycetota bacterium]
MEVWLEEFGKWAIVDAQLGLMPGIEGLPSSAIELQVAIAGEDTRLTCNASAEAARRWQAFILSNLFTFKVDQRLFTPAQRGQRVLVPKDAPWPRTFAGTHEEIFAGAIYTSNPAAQYQRPPHN